MNFATVGTSWITESFIRSGYLLDSFNLYSVYSRDASRAEAFALKNGAKKSFCDYDEMLTDDNIDAVYIASPNSLHFEQSMNALKHSKHVLCEKPAAVTPEQLVTLHNTAKENGVLFVEAIKSLHADALSKLREAVGLCGNIRSASIDFSQLSSKYKALKNGEVPNIFNPEFCTGGLMDLGVYNIYVAVELFGKPERIVSHCDFLPTGADHSGTILFIYNDKTVTLTYSKVGQSFAPSQIFGDEGTVTFASCSKLTDIKLYKNKECTEIYPAIDENVVMSMEIRDFIDFANGEHLDFYNECLDMSMTLCSLMYEIRKQNNFRF